ncbi:MAG: hypothetical protein RJB66_1881 [Pseudomonadota bacterium]|jgi:subtilisin family serine protease
MLNNRKSIIISSIIGSAMILFSGCRATHNQTMIPAEWRSYFNAAPVSKKIEQTNSQHKVLVAIIDSGVDYNHPLLKDHMHFDLDEKGIATGSGFDFVGNDSWPLPYLARTRHLYSKMETDLTEYQQVSANIKKMISSHKELEQWINPHRVHEDEAEQGIYHGTHVAGLASYDDSRIGILGYRVLPEQEAIGSSNEASIDTLLSYLEKSIEHAQKRGVKVVNMSIGLTFGEGDEGAAHLIEVFKKFEKIVTDHPDMVFVAAAGNESTWVNGETRYSFPCGIKADNMICVASQNANGIPSEFTNIPLITNPLIFAPGEQILSPFPTQFCQSPELSKLKKQMEETTLASVAKKILKDCPISKKNSVYPLSGTSMASPLIARAIASQILEMKRDASGKEIIDLFMKNSQHVQYGPLSLVRFRLPVPSWYPKGLATQGLGLADSSITRGYFEFYSKR